MSLSTTYTQARANFAKLCDKAIKYQEVITIHRRGSQDVALISALELSSLLETAHLLRSPKNAERLLRALSRAKKGSPKSSLTLQKLREETNCFSS